MVNMTEREKRERERDRERGGGREGEPLRVAGKRRHGDKEKEGGLPNKDSY